MEQKVASLEIEVSRLKYQNEKLEHLLKNNQDDLGKLIEDENYFGKTLLEIINRYPDQSWFPKVVHAHQPVDFFGTQRKKVLKDAFRVIIDYIVPVHVKTFKALFSQGSHIKLLDQYKKIRQSSKPHKFCKKEEDSVFDIFSKYDFSDSVIKSWKDDVGLLKGMSELEKLIHDLFKVRNSIFKTLSSMNDYFLNSWEDYFYQFQECT